MSYISTLGLNQSQQPQIVNYSSFPNIVNIPNNVGTTIASITLPPGLWQINLCFQLLATIPAGESMTSLDVTYNGIPNYYDIIYFNSSANGNSIFTNGEVLQQSTSKTYYTTVPVTLDVHVLVIMSAGASLQSQGPNLQSYFEAYNLKSF